MEKSEAEKSITECAQSWGLMGKAGHPDSLSQSKAYLLIPVHKWWTELQSG
jgi:hypothetical protein